MQPSTIALSQRQEAVSTRRTWLLLYLISASIILADQLSKWWIESTLARGEAIYPFDAISHIFRIVHVFNTGAAFGIFQNGGWVFSIIAVCVSAFIIYYNHQIAADQRLIRLALGLQMGGALGNVIDRIRLGHVTDFIHFNLRPLVANYPALDFQILNWPVFNIADTAVVTGVVILAYIMYTEEGNESNEVAATDKPRPRPAIPATKPEHLAVPIGLPQTPPLLSDTAELGDTRLIRFILIALLAFPLTFIVVLSRMVAAARKRRRRARRR